MRLVKMFGLAALTALASMAFLGAGSASANSDTALCKIHQDPCELANRTKEIHMVAGTTVLKTNLATVLCLASLVKGETEGEGLSKPLGVSTSEITWENCGTNAAHSNCTVVTEKVPLVDVLKTALNLGTATVLGALVKVNCSGIINCKYGGAEPTDPGYEISGFSVQGANHTEGAGKGMFTATELSVPVAGGFLCPKTSLWTALYEPLENIFGAS